MTETTTDPRGRDDNFMGRFSEEDLNRFTARQAVISVTIMSLILVLFSGGSIRAQGEGMKPGIGRDIVLAFGVPAGWVADQLPLADATANLTSIVSSEEAPLGNGFAPPSRFARGGVPAITPDDFEPGADGGRSVLAGEQPRAKQPLRQLLVTGDSLSTPLDLELQRKLAPEGVEVDVEPHLGTGISIDSENWGGFPTSQIETFHPDAVVIIIGANEGGKLPGFGGGKVSCCGPEWAAAYADRVRQMMEVYRQSGVTQVFWLTVMTPRDAEKQKVIETVNRAIPVAAEPWPDQVHVFDMVSVFTPGNRYRDTMEVDGSEQIVRDSDGIHLNETGSALAADLVIDEINRWLTY